VRRKLLALAALAVVGYVAWAILSHLSDGSRGYEKRLPNVDWTGW
jgi:hypothetical protein